MNICYHYFKVFFSFSLFILISSPAYPQAFINLDNIHLIIRGFGATNILHWHADMKTSEINTAFGTGDGQLGFSILRLRVPSDTNTFSANLTTATLAHSMGITLIASPCTQHLKYIINIKDRL